MEHRNRSQARLAWITLHAACAVAFIHEDLHAATSASWLNPVDGSWFDSTKWSTNPYAPNNGTPGTTTYDVLIAATGGSYTVSLVGNGLANNAPTVNSFALGSSNSTLAVTNDTSFGLGAIAI